jgi:hypothetical protein
MSEKNPTLTSIILTAVDQGIASMRVCLPGRIESFDPDTQLASVKPLIPNLREDLDGEFVSESLAVIKNVPVIFEGTSNFYLTYPIQQGDRCELRFTDRSYDAWLTNGEDIEPNETRRHDLTDAVAVMGLRDQGHKITEFDSNRPAMGKKSGPKITFSDDKIEIGGDHNEAVAQFAAMANLVKDALDALKSAVESHYHPNGNNGAPTGGPTSDPAGAVPLKILTSTAVAAQKVKIK